MIYRLETKGAQGRLIEADTPSAAAKFAAKIFSVKRATPADVAELMTHGVLVEKADAEDEAGSAGLRG